MISNNYQQQLNYGAIKDRVPQNIGDKLPPSVQNYDVRESVGENTAVKAAKNANMEPVTIAMTGGLWLAFAQICQHLNNKLNANWENSWLGKIGKKFDGISNKLNIGKNQSKIRGFISNITDKSKILRTLKTPTRPQNSMAITQARGITGYVMSDVSSMLGYHLKNGHGDDILNLVNGMADFKGKTGEEALSYIDDLFKNCEINSDKIKELVQRLSKSDISVSVDNLINGNIPFTKVKVKIPNIPFLKRKGSFKEMANKLNAVLSDTALGKQATNIGKSMPKQALKALEGLTNGGAGGKLMIVIQASIFAQAIKKAMDAPEGEKMSTFTENIANDFGFFLSLPFQVKASHAIGGLKYIGINGAKNASEQVANVQTYRNMIKELNEKVAKGTISSIDYIKEKDAIKNFLKGDSKWYHKPLKALGKFFSTGLDEETIKPFINNADKSLSAGAFNKFRGIVNKIKGPGIGTVLRFAVGTMVVGPIIAKGITKVSHLIFGRPSKSVLDEDKTEEKVQDNSANNPLNMSEEELMQKLAAHPEIIQKMQNDPKFAQEILNNPELFKKYLNGEIKIDSTNNNPEILNSKYIVKPQQTTQGTVAPNPQNPLTSQPNSQMSAINNNPSQSKMDLFGLGKKDKEENAEDTTQQEQDPLEPKRTYIPSSQCTIGKTNEEEALNGEVANAISRADRVEQEALKRLGM